VKYLKNILIHPKSIVLIFISIAVLVVFSAIIELNQSKKEMLELMEKQSHSLLETLLVSSSNAILSYDKIEDELKHRLLNNALLIKILYEKGMVSNKLIEEIALQNNLFRINIFNRNGKKKFSSQKKGFGGQFGNENQSGFLNPLFNGETDTLIIGIKQARFNSAMRYVVAVATSGRDAIVLNVDAEELLKFRKQVGFGVLLKDIAKSSNIVFALLQDNKNIIAAAGKDEYIELLDSSKISLDKEGGYSWRISEAGGYRFFEAQHRFVYNNSPLGVFRLGLSLEPLENINGRITRRIVFISIFLFIFGSVTLAFVFIRQNFLLLSKKHKSFEEYSKNIIDNIDESIILLDRDNIIISANRATETVLGAASEDIVGKHFASAFQNQPCGDILNGAASLVETECVLKGKNKTFLISKNYFLDEKHESRTILVINDLTEKKELEKHIVRKERLAAMGELASSVAHEIRNPLNAISTIVQQLNKDFEPKENVNEFREFTKLVYSEVNRINSTIESFLRFARPLELSKELFSISTLLKHLFSQYAPLLKEKNIIMTIVENWSGEVCWDRSQILQVLINLIENSIDALKPDGLINISVEEAENSNVLLVITDTGSGIDDHSIDKIFNLYFTTKQKGSGIGLSIVQKIISAHNGKITVKSSLREGTTFNILLPKNI